MTRITKVVIILGITALFATTAHAHHGLHHRPHHPHYAPPVQKHYHYRDWVAPAVVISGAIIAAEIARQRELERVETERVIIERQPLCSDWREVQDSNGRIYRERTCRQ